MNLEVFASAISQMAEQCPYNGSVTATFTVHDRNARLKSVVSAEDTADVRTEKNSKARVFTPDFTALFLYDLDRLRVYYGEIVFEVNVRDGSLLDYTCRPVTRWSAARALSRSRSLKFKGAA